MRTKGNLTLPTLDETVKWREKIVTSRISGKVNVVSAMCEWGGGVVAVCLHSRDETGACTLMRQSHSHPGGSPDKMSGEAQINFAYSSLRQ